MRQCERPHVSEFVPVAVLPVAQFGRIEQLGIARVEPSGGGATAIGPSKRPKEGPMLSHTGADEWRAQQRQRRPVRRTHILLLDASKPGPARCGPCVAGDGIGERA